MNLHFYLERLHETDVFKEFSKKNKSAYLCSAFFVIDKESNDNNQHFDFFVPKEKKAFSFQSSNNMQEELKLVPLESFADKIPEKIKNIGIDFKEIEQIILGEMEKNQVKNKIQKMIFSLQKIKGKDMLLCTIFISMLGMVNLNIDVKTKKAQEFKKRSLFDMIKIVKK
ncbi:hypothetical protein HY448_01410 [Candidatus Pacearchaeota archaeon]|nr:hypothetical protein [Candidatus Pacearchaeota archaeon]